MFKKIKLTQKSTKKQMTGAQQSGFERRTVEFSTFVGLCAVMKVLFLGKVTINCSLMFFCLHSTNPSKSV
jgi:hypothetical protein